MRTEALQKRITGLQIELQKANAPKPKAQMVFTFAPFPDPVVLGGPLIPVHDITLPLKPDGSVHVRFTLVNDSAVVAETLQAVLDICTGCKFAKEPEGFTRIPGSKDTERNHLYGNSPARGATAELAADIIPPANTAGFKIRLRYRCNTCVVDDNGTEGTIHIQRN